MYLAELNIILSTCLFFTEGFGMYNFGKGYKLLINEYVSSNSLLDSKTIKTRWIHQPLDHFDASETRNWKMKYFERLDFWKPDGPIYLFISGEWKADTGFLQTGILYDLAKETNGAMYLTEHRYYGDSMPFENLSTENLIYLSSRQALADVAKLLIKIKSTPILNSSKVVVVGGSYSGNLAAWMKLLYPDLIDAAIASSAPVLAKKDFFEYLENVGDDFEQHGTPDCSDNIALIFNRYDELLKTADGIKQLRKEEQICDTTDMTKPENKQLFFLDKTSEFMYKAQYGDPDKIKEHCKQLSNTSHVMSSKDDDTNIWNEKYNCFDYDFANMITYMKDIDWLVSWTYQTCTEFSYFPSTSSNKHPFTDNIHMDLFYMMCTMLYGPEYDEKRIDEGVTNTNEMYGGLKPNLTHVVFVNGDLDPYHMLGILEDVTYEAPAKVIPLASHCQDLFSDRKGDPEELMEARRYVKYLIKKWIGAGEFKKTKRLIGVL